MLQQRRYVYSHTPRTRKICWVKRKKKFLKKVDEWEKHKHNKWVSPFLSFLSSSFLLSRLVQVCEENKQIWNILADNSSSNAAPISCCGRFLPLLLYSIPRSDSKWISRRSVNKRIVSWGVFFFFFSHSSPHLPVGCNCCCGGEEKEVWPNNRRTQKRSIDVGITLESNHDRKRSDKKITKPPRKSEWKKEKNKNKTIQ